MWYDLNYVYLFLYACVFLSDGWYLFFLLQAMSTVGQWKAIEGWLEDLVALHEITIDVSSQVTHEDHENGAVSTSEGGVVSWLFAR